MKLPRNVSGGELIKALKLFDYAPVRQDGSHVRLTTDRNGTHHVTIPNHSPIKLGTLSAILKSVATHQKLTVEELVRRLDL